MVLVLVLKRRPGWENGAPFPEIQPKLVTCVKTVLDVGIRVFADTHRTHPGPSVFLFYWLHKNYLNNWSFFGSNLRSQRRIRTTCEKKKTA